ncbi:MAG: hypothetical protein C0505_00230 [Leptothrix sp. (in: Bacteria)]|nr:hypothetical protein [Leptothrix sp. (in: b-proteobacteria)]
MRRLELTLALAVAPALRAGAGPAAGAQEVRVGVHLPPDSAAVRDRRQADGLELQAEVAEVADTLTEDKALCLSAGMNDFVIKPYSRELLLGTLMHWLQRTPRAAGTSA